MLVAIPSRSRAASVLDHPKTGWFLQLVEEDFPIMYFVPAEQASGYAAAIEGRYRVVATPAEGIAATRKAIGAYAQRHGYSKFLMLDDDVSFYRRKSPTQWNLRDAARTEMSELLAEISGLLNTNEIVGVSPREGNNRAFGVVENTRIIRATAFQTGAFNECEHGRVQVMEDFDILLQILRRGGTNVCIYEWAQGQKQTQAPGGCSDYRTHASHEASARLLAQLHPGLVKLREKKNKGGGEFGHRLEVTIAWKKAAAEGKKAKK